MSATAPPRRSTALLLAGGAVALLALLAVGRVAGAYVPALAERVRELGAAGPPIFIVGYAVAVVGGVPGALLTLAAGAIFGLWAGTLWVLIGATCGASLSFLIARYAARDMVSRRMGAHARFAAIDRAIAADGRRIVFLLRLSPAVPFTVLNYLLGITRVRFADFVAASVGMLPGTLLYVHAGKVAGDVAAAAAGAAPARGAGHYAVVGLGLLATLVATVLVTRAARRALAAHVDAPGAAPTAVPDAGLGRAHP